ncbi:MarR family transcriptional regulator [uncultured Albimonas sp.]|uniref:MarR family winged helix-turn-helix transcriptional regulator n=1 Tax=uncultured Albimonas sp. TaxID=1331701 RepID=UPI0030EDC175|tara:strand:+ start:156 stop:617 length:462 start_codon:yes stop_codon:yes gene_type:complete
MSTEDPLVRPSIAQTLEVRDRCLCLAAQRAARALARRFDEAFRPLGLTNGQFSLMMALNQPTPPAMGRVAAMLAMDPSTLTAALKPLVRRELVEIAPDPADRRGRRAALTGAGRALLGAALPIWTQTHATIDAELAERGTAPDALRDAIWSLA